MTLALAATGWIRPHSAWASPSDIDPQGSPDTATGGLATAGAGVLLTRYAELRPQLEQSPFDRPLYLESAAGSHASQGDVYALVGQPMATVTGSLASPDSWCDVLMLHLNVKYCRADTRGGRPTLHVAIGTKHEQSLEDAYPVEFTYGVTSSATDYMDVVLDAAHGPFGTRDYRIELEAVAIDGGRTLLHLRYSFAYGFQARVAMALYLATAGSDKVGFTQVTPGDRRPPQPVRGLRGAVERNVMRYYLAVDAYLATVAAPEPDRFWQSLDVWFNATEAYATQLHEVDRDTYLAMKRQERERQMTLDEKSIR
jgi:hypothetical protein